MAECIMGEIGRQSESAQESEAGHTNLNVKPGRIELTRN